MILADAAGWFGALVLVAAYAASTGGQPRRPMVVHMGNLVGSLGLGAVAAAHRALPSVMVNAVWLVIAVRALAREFDHSVARQSGRRPSEEESRLDQTCAAIAIGPTSRPGTAPLPSTHPPASVGDRRLGAIRLRRRRDFFEHRGGRGSRLRGED